MATSLYLAMTAAEYLAARSLPHRIAWMACHFSPYGLGLSNIPASLPEGSLLILSDVIPIQGHDPLLVAQELTECLQLHRCHGLLLDFQRVSCREAEALTDILTREISFPMAVSEPYAGGRGCPVFLPPCPPHVSLKEYIAPWAEREIWLEAAFSHTQLLLTPSGTAVSQNTSGLPDGPVFPEETLCCHYSTQVTDTDVRFHLWRTEEDLNALMEVGAALKIQKFVGLYQELGSFRNQ